MTITTEATPPATTPPAPAETEAGAAPTAEELVDAATAVAASIAPLAADHDRDGTFVHEAFSELRARGFLAALVPTDFGGSGATHRQAGRILTELAKGCPATAVTLSMHYHLVATQIWRHRHDQPAEPFLRKVATEQPLLLSTGAADWVGSVGEAAPTEGGFRVTARKTPTSGAPMGDIVVSSAPVVDGGDRPEVIHFAVPMTSAGVSVDATWDTMGMRGTGSHTVVMDDVFVPDAAVSLRRPADEWHPVWSAVLGSAMPLIMAAYLGVAESAVALAVDYAGRPSTPASATNAVGEMVTSLTATRDSVDAMFDASADLTFAPTVEHTASVLARKTNAAESAIATVRRALDVCGGAGYSRSFGLERLYRDVHGALYHPLPLDKQREFTGRVALGLDPLAT